MKPASKNPVELAVIILNFNKKEDLLDCLESVGKTSAKPGEIIVVDNGSTDGSSEAVAERFPGIHLVRSSVNLGASGGRNLGLRYANEHLRPGYLLFLDNDTIVNDRCLSRLLSALRRNEKAGIAGPKAYRDLSERRIMSAGIRVNFATGSVADRGSGETDQGQFDDEQSVAACGGFGLLVRTDLANRLNGFDEAFNPYSWEDVDFCLRAKRAGFQTLYVPSATLIHKGGKIGRGVIKTYERYKARNFIYLIRRHGRLWEQAAFLLTGPVRALRIIAREFAGGNRKLFGAMSRGVWDALNNRKGIGRG